MCCHLNANAYGLRMNLDEQVTHNPDLECYADRVLYLQDGRIVK